jgi:hypothetical protein
MTDERERLREAAVLSILDSYYGESARTEAASPLLVRQIVRAVLAQDPPQRLDVETLAWAVFGIATSGMGVDPNRPEQPDETDRNYAEALAAEYVRLCDETR